jgi:hypothetical protein
VTVAGNGLFEIDVADIDAPISVGGSVSIVCNTLSDVFLTKSAASHSLDVTVQQSYSGLIRVSGALSSAQLTFFSDYRGLIEVLGAGSALENLNGSIDIAGDWLAPGRIRAKDFGVSGQPALEIGGSITGTPGNFTPAVDLTGQLKNVIAISGRLANICTSAPEIRVNSLAAAAAIAIDYDGEDFADEWSHGATIEVASTTYTGNSPSARVYEITACLGDMNNDGVVDSDDIDPFELTASQYAS